MKAHLVFIDESGLLLAPLVRRSWSPRGRTPTLYQRTRRHEKVSMIAALSVSPKRRRVGLYFSLGANANINTAWMVAFLKDLARHLRGPIIVIWDRLTVHRARMIAQLVAARPRLHLVLLPPYSPELNPAEYFFAYLKMNPLANRAAEDTEQLFHIGSREVQQIARQQDLLRSFIQATPLSLWPS